MTLPSAASTGAGLPIVILISGRGSNMRVIAERAASGALPVEIRAVISDKADAPGLATASAMGIPAVALSPGQFADRAAYDAALASLVAGYEPKLVVLAGFMRILTPTFIEPFAGRILNIHPSLLPRYRGLHTHRRALEAGDAEHGVSVHLVTQELDGGPVIIQAHVPVLPSDTEDSLSARVQREEHRIYPLVIDWIARGRLTLEGELPRLDGEVLHVPVRFTNGD
ncbi:MAG TPA: phosphoribosylglycinamide formyltransferase [Povalibacter sp.]|jgi:phosphoribosylglycinamide formyltransferase-1|nr:phosphoribosylglycinamide formyltransferase [Povalibacter sp.]